MDFQIDFEAVLEPPTPAPTANSTAGRSRGGGRGGGINPSPLLGFRGLVDLIGGLARALHALRLSASSDFSVTHVAQDSLT